MVLRNSDGISIDGGDLLTHPQIVEIMRMIARVGMEPIVSTNGALLTKELLHELQQAGVDGFTFYIDRKQRQPEWKNENEVELNQLRLHCAEMLAEVGTISCAFNSTVYVDTLQYVPDLVDRTAQHFAIIQVLVFVLYRAAVPNLPFDRDIMREVSSKMRDQISEIATSEIHLLREERYETTGGR